MNEMRGRLSDAFILASVLLTTVSALIAGHDRWKGF
jgi:hypothetical protein